MKVKISRLKNTNYSFPKVTILYRDSCNEDEHFPYKNLRRTIGCCVENIYGEYSEENIKRFEQNLALSDGCLDNLSGCQGLFNISIKDLMIICDYCFNRYIPNRSIPSDVLIFWIKAYVKEYSL